MYSGFTCTNNCMSCATMFQHMYITSNHCNKCAPHVITLDNICAHWILNEYHSSSSMQHSSPCANDVAILGYHCTKTDDMSQRTYIML